MSDPSAPFAIHSLMISISPRRIAAGLLFLALFCALRPEWAASQRAHAPGVNPEVEARFQKALDRYKQGDFAQARSDFQALADARPIHPQSSAATLMLAKTLYKLQEYPLALATVAQLYEAFPESRYLREGDLVAGDCRFRQGDAAVAAEQYARVLRSEADVRLKARAADRLGQMVTTMRLTPAQTERLRKDLSPSRFEEVTQFGRARWASRLGRAEAASAQAASFLKAFPDSPFAGEARALMRSAPASSAIPASAAPVARLHFLKVAVLCPTSRDAGKDLRDGALLAQTLASPPNVDSLRVVFEDSDDDPVTSVRLVQTFAQDRDVVAIVGDLTSRTTLPAAAVANALQMPMITPTASEDGIAAIGPCVFQINATPGAQGRKIAASAFERGLRTFAILAASDAYGKHMAEAFAGKVEALGGKVVAREWYTPGTTDFQTPIQRIREVGMSMAGTAPAATDTTGSEAALPAPGIDGLLVAAQTPEDVVMAVSQMLTSPVAVHLLGGDGWNSPSVSREIGAAQGVLFVSKYYEDPSDAAGRRFREAFRARYGRAPNVASALGYDAMSCVLRAIAAGGASREALRERLAAGQAFDGATGRVSLPPGERQNSGMYVLTVRDGKIVLADQ